MKSTHTHAPGLWRVTESAFSHSNHGELHVGTPDRTACVVYFERHDSIETEFAASNARLIAAAPDLLEALTELLQERYVDGDESDQEFDAQGNWTCNSPASVKARAALARAKGGAA